MQVGRAEIGGDAIMVLTLDKKVDDTAKRSLELINGLNEVQVLDITAIETAAPF